MFMLIVAGALVLTALGAAFFGGDGRAPRPGAVWSAEHGHWH